VALAVQGAVGAVSPYLGLLDPSVAAPTTKVLDFRSFVQASPRLAGSTASGSAAKLVRFVALASYSSAAIRAFNGSAPIGGGLLSVRFESAP
jgi:hypothetical protein